MDKCSLHKVLLEYIILTLMKKVELKVAKVSTSLYPETCDNTSLLH